MKTIGIDPGINGAVCIIQNDNYKFIKTIPEKLKEIYDEIIQADIIAIENVHAYPEQGSVSTFNFGYNYGMLKGLLYLSGKDFYSIEPRVWQSYYELPKIKNYNERKKQLYEEAKKYFPFVSKNEADALLIANYIGVKYGNI